MSARKIIALCAILAASPASAEVIMRDDGGQIRDYIQRAATAESIEIRGECYSACTLLLRAENVCVSREATLYFHMPRFELPDGSVIVAWEHKDWVMNKYPEPIRDMIEEFGGLKEEFTTISGGTVIDYAGVDDCDEKPFESQVPWFEK
jgi:hypothetical protein